MRRSRLVRMADRGAMSSLIDTIFLVLVVTLAILGTWVLTLSTGTRSTVQNDEYGLRYTSLGLTRWLQSTVPNATVTDPSQQVVQVRDQKVVELLGLELAFRRQGAPAAADAGLGTVLKASLDALVLPEHGYSMAATDTTPPGGAVGPSEGMGMFMLITSEGVGGPTWEGTFPKGEVYTSSYTYDVPASLAGDAPGTGLRLMVSLACWPG